MSRRAALVLARRSSCDRCSISRKERTMILVGAEEVMDAAGVRGCFGCDDGDVPVAAAATWLAMGDKLRDIPMEERGRELAAVDMARNLETALTGLTASNALASSNSARVIMPTMQLHSSTMGR